MLLRENERFVPVNIMQSIFRPASRREALGEHAGGGRHDGGLKMGWAKPSGCGDIYGYRLPTQSLRGSEAAGDDERVGRSGWVALPPMSCHGVGDRCRKNLCHEPRGNEGSGPTVD